MTISLLLDDQDTLHEMQPQQNSKVDVLFNEMKLPLDDFNICMNSFAAWLESDVTPIDDYAIAIIGAIIALPFTSSPPNMLMFTQLEPDYSDRFQGLAAIAIGLLNRHTKVNVGCCRQECFCLGG